MSVSGRLTGSREPSPDGLGPSGFDPARGRELADRCETAAVPDRELDCLIHCAVNGWRVVYEGVNVFADMGEGMRRILVGWLDPGREARNFSLTSNSLAPNYTASLDAAMSLIESREPNEIVREAVSALSKSFNLHVTFWPVGKSYAQWLARFVVAAALRARSASVDTHAKRHDPAEGHGPKDG